MILEVAQLTIKAGQDSEFIEAMKRAASFLLASDGYLGHDVHQCLETPTRFTTDNRAKMFANRARRVDRRRIRAEYRHR